MNFIQRLGYYLGGFAVGLIFLSFFLSGKRTSCSYSTQARAIKNINLKDLQLSEEVSAKTQTLNITESQIAELVRSGQINFSKSNTELDSCKQYLIENKEESSLKSVLVENCAEVATVLDININLD